MIVRSSLLRSLAEHTRAVVAAANGAPVDCAEATCAALCAAGLDPDACSPDLRATAWDAVEACIYALGGEVQS